MSTFTDEERAAIAQVVEQAVIGAVAAIANLAGIDPQLMTRGIRYTPEQIDRLIDEVEKRIEQDTR